MIILKLLYAFNVISFIIYWEQVVGYGLDSPGFESHQNKRFSLLQKSADSFCAHPASYSTDIKVPSQG